MSVMNNTRRQHLVFDILPIRHIETHSERSRRLLFFGSCSPGLHRCDLSIAETNRSPDWGNFVAVHVGKRLGGTIWCSTSCSALIYFFIKGFLSYQNLFKGAYWGRENM